MLSNHLTLCSPLLLLPLVLGSFPVSWFFTSGGQNTGASASNKYSGLITFKIDWFDLLAVQGTLKSLLQHHNSQLSILQCSAFFVVQLPHPYMTNGKTKTLTIQTFVCKVMSVLFNMLSRFVIAFLPKSMQLLISWLQSMSTVLLESKKMKFVTASTFSLLFANEVMGLDVMILVF